MSHDALSDIVDRYLNDASFQAAFDADPERAVADAGYHLDDAELSALHSTVTSREDQPLRPRVSKYSFGT
jgi:hypothetical protein